MMKYFYILILLNLIITFTPFKLASYILPFITLGYIIIFYKSRILIIKSLLWVSLWVFMALFYGILYPDFYYVNTLIAFVTWSGLFVILSLPYLGRYAYITVRKIEKWVWLILLIESTLGISQAVYGALRGGGFDLNNGDHVEGTIHPWLPPENAYANVMFAINIIILLLYLLPQIDKKIYKYAIYTLGIIVFILASVMHAIIFLIISYILTTIILSSQKVNIKWIFIMGLFIFSTIILLPILMPKNVNLIDKFIFQLTSGEVPRSASIKVALIELPKEYPLQPIVGLGPGQYSSRAGLICTGYYFGGFRDPKYIPYLPNSPTTPQQRYLIPLWKWHASNIYFGSTQKPYSSWISIYTEWGLIGIFAILFILIFSLSQVYLLQTSYLTKASIMTIIWFIFLLGFQENNWEIPQAWFGSLMLIRLLYDSEKYKIERLGVERS